MNKISYAIKNRLSGIYGIWFITLALLNVSQISSYYHTTINKFVLVFCVTGILYCKRNKILQKENRICFIITTILSAMIAAYWIRTNVFSVYLYYNYTLGLALIIYSNLYVALIRSYIVTKTRPKISVFSMTLLALFTGVLVSRLNSKLELFFIIFVVAIFILDPLKKEEKIQATKGMIDGICVGFVIAQTYAFGFQPYNEVRYKGYCIYTTCAGLMYMYTYVAFLVKYIIAKMEKEKVWKTRLYWWSAAGVLSLLYLTGGRSPVLGIIVITGMCLFVLQWIQNKKVNFMKWLVQCIAIGLVSILLFPVAYMSVRYLPTIINKPDYIDGLGNRYYSPMRLLGQMYLYNAKDENGEFIPIEYISFEYSFYHCLGRIVPGGTDIIEKVYDTVGISLEDVLPEAKEKEPFISEAKFDDPSKRGTSAEYPWFPADYEATSFEIRSSIHQYAIKQLNWLGHESSELKFYMFDGSGAQPHAHNIFLIYGYNYGIVPMFLMIMMFLMLLYKYIRCVIQRKEGYWLFGLGMIGATIIFGMFEFSFAPTQYITYIIYILGFFVPEKEF